MPVGEGRLVGLIRDGLPADKMIGVALSGGGDSTALLHLRLAAGFRVEAVTVDHRLRADSAAEAAAVGEWCRVLGVRHEIRVWEHGAVEGNLMDQARRARMALIAGWAEARGIGVVALGHTRDDVAETVLMGLSRAAGIAGLSGMRREFDAGRVRVHRPLLDAGREELRAWLRGQGIRWVDDPTNENDRFTRVKARKALAALAPLVEETIFRGYVYAGLRTRLATPAAAVLSAGMFAFAHLNMAPSGLAAVALVGVLLAYLYENTRSLWPSVVVHAFHNTLAFLVILGAGI